MALVGADPLFADRVSPKGGPEHWCCFSYRNHYGLFPSTQIFLPAAQINDLAAVLSAHSKPPAGRADSNAD